MKPFVFQDWITVRSTGTPPAPAGPNFVQDVAGWLDLTLFQDVVFWFDLRQTSTLAGCDLTWNLQTGPTKDDVLFQTMVFSGPYGTIPTRVLSVIPVTLAGARIGGTIPLATWVRWMIQPGGVFPNQPWSATFRVIVAANQVTRGRTRVGRSAAMPAPVAATKFGVKKPPTKLGGVATVPQTMTPISLGGLGSNEGTTSLVQPVTNVQTFGGLGGLGS